MILNDYVNNSDKFNIPENIKSIRFDIGLSYCAPNSSYWLNTNKETFVIGVEANKYAVNSIIKNGLYTNQYELHTPYPNNNFLLLNLALDNVDEPTTKPFYHMLEDVGVSSLLKPTKALNYSIQELSDVNVYSFYDLLNKIDWNKFKYIELVKIDTQGKDLDIIKSAKSYLDKIVYLNCEVNTFNYYENNPKPYEFDEYMIANNFEKILNNSYVNGEVVDITYFNKNYEILRNKIDLHVL